MVGAKETDIEKATESKGKFYVRIKKCQTDVFFWGIVGMHQNAMHTQKVGDKKNQSKNRFSRTRRTKFQHLRFRTVASNHKNLATTRVQAPLINRNKQKYGCRKKENFLRQHTAQWKFLRFNFSTIWPSVKEMNKCKQFWEQKTKFGEFTAVV